MSTFQRSLELTKASWRMLRQDRELVLLPVLSIVTWLVVAATFFVPIALLANDAAADESWTANPVNWVLAFAGYAALAYVGIFFNAAIICAADERMRGGDPTVGSALSAAADRAGALLPWALVSATVSLILRAIEERAGFVGKIVAAIAGLAWSLVTYLVLPILVVERIGVRDAVKRSADLFRRTWGEQVVSNFGVSLVAFLAVLAGVVVCVPLLLVGGPAAVVAVALLAVWIALVVVVASALSGILQLARYRYAVNGSVPGFDTDQLRGAFKPKQRFLR